MPVKRTFCWPAVTVSTSGLGIGSSVGGWLTAVTVTLKVREKVFTPPLAVPPLS